MVQTVSRAEMEKMLILITGNKIIKKKYRFFTLIELMVVIVIISAAVGMSVSAIRATSPARKLAVAGEEIVALCARARFLATEAGEERTILFLVEDQKLIIATPGQDADGFQEERVLYSWKMPEGFVWNPELEIFGREAEAAEVDALEIFRFFPDGMASASRTFVLNCDGLESEVRIAPLTGAIKIQERDSGL